MLNKLIKFNATSSKAAYNGSRYYFSRLTDEQKIIYDAVFSGVKTYSKEIKMPLKPINEMSMIFNYVLFDNPMIFYISSFSVSNDLYKNKCFFKPDYKYAKHLSKEKSAAIKEYLQVFDGIKDKSNFDKEIYVHDYCLNNFKYDYTFNDLSHTVLGPIFNKTAVCEGIAKFVKLAFDYLGVKSLVVSGKAKNPAQRSTMENHAWNIVKIDGKTYHLDVTFDMTIKNKANRYDYFNLSDDDIKKDHIIIDVVPKCTTTGNDYFSKNSLLANNISEFERIVENGLKRGLKNITVKLSNTPYTTDIVDKLMEIAQKQYIRTFKRGVALNVGYNANQMVFELNFKGAGGTSGV